MKRKIVILVVVSIVVIFGLLLYAVQAKIYAARTRTDGSRKIIVYKAGIVDSAKEEIIRQASGVKLRNLDLINAKAVRVSSAAGIEKLKANPDVARVDEDVEVFALQEEVDSLGTDKNKTSSQTPPWGIDRIDAELVWPRGNTADPVKVGIIDSGISNSHPDLKANIKGGANIINSRRSWNDDNGHGSHVAGIVAALNNGFGVVGVAPRADLYAIKVLDSTGSSNLSDVIGGIQWAVENRMQVINMSLGTPSNVRSFHDAVIAAVDADVVVVSAAGNSGGSVIFPAAYDEAIAVSATNQNNIIANWSSRGPEVDLAAPGDSIYSTYKGTRYITRSGTSMAAPHVAGFAALILNTPVGAYDINANGAWDPDEVQKKMQNRTVDLGDAGFDNIYGWGLVNVYKALQP